MSLDFVQYYQSLVILQYVNKPKAIAEIKALSEQFESAYDMLATFVQAFDVDTATGDRLDKIGSIVGQSRTIQNLVVKKYFGFDDNPDALGFGDGPFFNLTDPEYSSGELDDPRYRLFIKARIAKNIASCYAFSDEKEGLVSTYLTLFDGKAIIVDNKDMTLSLYVDPSYSLDDLRILQEEKLLPTPQGVGIELFYSLPADHFGFSDDPNALGFGVGQFASLIEI